MTNRLGPRVLGEEKFEEQEQEATRIGSHLGPRVLGHKMTGEDPEEVAEKAKASEVKTRPEGDEPPNPVKASALDKILADEEGTGHVEAGPAPKDPESVGDQDGDGYATLSELETALEEDPSLTHQAFTAELQRESPRVGAFKLLKSTEEAKEEPDSELLAQIEAAQE